MKKVFLLTGLLTMFSIATFAKHVDENIAKQVGQSFLLHSTKTLKTSVNLDLVYTSSSSSSFATANTQPTTFFYVFNDGANGFVIVAGDDNVTPILGYSDEGIFDPNNIPQSVQKWLEEYKNQIRYVVDNNVSATKEIQKEWKNYVSGTTQSVAKASVNPLMTTKWNQSPYYNALCPSGTVTGCVATAMAQVMKYWNYPATGTGFHSYNHPTYGTLSANFGSTTYQWGSMPNTVNSSNNAVATLMYHCGVSVNMNYGPASTGGSSATYQATESALKNYFGYKNTLQLIVRSSYNQTQWINLLKTELDASRPILYAGIGSGGGHAFVCDGYDNNDFFHFNWGWGGNPDGYFQVNALNPGSLGTGGGSGGFNTNQQAIIGIEPINGGAPQTYDLQLYSNINMPSTQIWFTNPFSLTVDIANFGTGNFSGQYGAAIFDHNYNFVDWLEVKSNMTLGSNQHYTNGLTFSNAGSTAFVPGTYYTALFYKTTTQNWTIVGDGSYTNLKQFEIIYTSDIETNSAFTITNNGGKLIQGSSAIVNVDLLNTGSTFYGQYRISLSNLNGTFAQSIQILNENNGLPNGYHYTGGNNFTGNITVAPGTYLMEVAYKAQGSSSWYYAGSSNYSNPVYVIVEAPGLLPDQYEVNNTVATAYTLPISFSGNTATKNTVGSNHHVGTDNDYYKINLPTGYSYTITARLHDSYNSGNGNTYTVDGLFSYSTDGGSTWSDAYDDIMTSNITLSNGGTVHFRTAPYFSGETGTYLLDMTINRTATVGIEELTDNSDLIKVYPNPATEFVTVDLNDFSENVNSVNVINVNGQQISSTKVVGEKILKLPLQGLSDGVYFIQIQSDQGMLTKKIIVRQ